MNKRRLKNAAKLLSQITSQLVKEEISFSVEEVHYYLETEIYVESWTCKLKGISKIIRTIEGFAFFREETMILLVTKSSFTEEQLETLEQVLERELGDKIYDL